MDRAEVSKRIERAEKLLHKGKTADALEEYLIVLNGDPGNDAVRGMAAELSLSLQRVPEAVKLLGELFDHQMQAGDATQASLTYKKLTRFASPTWQQKFRFGQLLENSNRKLAIETYDHAVEELTALGSKTESLTVLKRLIALDPTEKNLVRMGELAAEVGEGKTAAAAFLKYGQMLEASGQDASPWFEKAYTQDQSNIDVAFAYGKSLLLKGEVGAAIFVLEPRVQAGTASPELREAYASALLAADRYNEAEPLIWAMYEHNPLRMPEVTSLIGLLIDAKQDADAVALARKLEQSQRRRGDRKSFAAEMQDIVAQHRPSPEVLEFMGELFNSSNRESDYSQTLLKLFDLYYGVGNYFKAAECLDRAAEVDAYEPGHLKRLESLRGKVEDNRLKAISSRFTGLGSAAPEPVKTEEPTLGASALQDLILQAEILVQYGMKAKATERAQHIHDLFPRAEERNEDLQRLFMAVGIVPKYADAPKPAPPPEAKLATPTAAQSAAAEAADVSSFTKVAEITQKLYQQGNADAVLSTAVNEIGAQWKVARCIAAMRKPGLPATAIKESRADGVPATDAKTMAKLVAALHDLAVATGGVSIDDVSTSSDVNAVREILDQLSIKALIALPLSEGPHHMGVLLIAQGSTHRWRSSDMVVLKTLSDQIVMATHNAGLRRLVKNLSVTDEHSGLLRRASYIDMLLGETRRALQQNGSLTVVLMQFGKHGALVKEYGDAAIGEIWQRIGQLCAAHIRQNDLAFQYDSDTIALVLSETGTEEALASIDKLRRTCAQVCLPGKEEPVPFNAGLAEAVIQPPFDPVDIVTEVINRVEQALEAAVGEGPNKVTSLAPTFASAAVA
ncbi:MAG TPA: diguanylate cyclase [Terriglobales bacterium]|jgi:tetratricopeptide (TPR) repeat protein|nr:diguanylate cyclase [Terriglobales bacterium]